MLRPGQALMLILASLLAIGVVAVHSAGVDLGSPRSYEFLELLTARTTMLALLAGFVAWAASRLPIQSLADQVTGRRVAAIMLVLSIALLALVHVPGIGREVNGARRWLTIGPIGFQPSEVAKWSLVIIIAWYASTNAMVLHRFRRGFLPGMGLAVLLVLPVVTEDLGTAVLMLIVALSLLVATGCRLLHAATLLPFAAMGFVAAVLVSPYRVDRLRAFLDPYSDPQGIGYHILQSMSAISGGGLAGRGLGNSVQKFGYLPEDTTDFIFAIICEELGVAGVLVIVTLLIAMLVVGRRIARDARCIHQKVLVLGIMLTFGLQALMNLLVVTGLAPTKGIALPLLSWGGTGWLATSACLGLVWAVDRNTAAGERENTESPALLTEGL
ncbi:MAG: FtsW/RodA/SpoVE family cell cycle protein [Phycisphaerales bacterium]|nr:FtsW/RodA/SpoVE family cell cycle protein [Phycisphaerales bacterium]